MSDLRQKLAIICGPPPTSNIREKIAQLKGTNVEVIDSVLNENSYEVLSKTLDEQLTELNTPGANKSQISEVTKQRLLSHVHPDFKEEFSCLLEGLQPILDFRDSPLLARIEELSSTIVMLRKGDVSDAEILSKMKTRTDAHLELHKLKSRIFKLEEEKRLQQAQQVNHQVLQQKVAILEKVCEKAFSKLHGVKQLLADVRSETTNVLAILETAASSEQQWTNYVNKIMAHLDKNYKETDQVNPNCEKVLEEHVEVIQNLQKQVYALNSLVQQKQSELEALQNLPNVELENFKRQVQTHEEERAQMIELFKIAARGFCNF